MRLLVYGAGAVGTYVGGSLAARGHAVTFIARPQTAAAIARHGLSLMVGERQLRVPGVGVAGSPVEAFAAGEYDVVLLTLKSFDTRAALAQLAAVTSAPPPILCLQNGVDNEAEIAEVFGPGSVIAGTVTSAVSRVGPGEIVVERRRGVGLALGHPLSARLLEACSEAGLRPRAYRSPGRMKWSKLLTNLIGNATAAILDMPVADLFADARLFSLERGVLRECLAVMRALRCAPVNLPGTPVRALALAVAWLPPRAARLVLRRGVSAGRGHKRPSFHIDLDSGRRTEVHWLHGAVARHGAAHGVPAPLCRQLTDLLEGLHRDPPRRAAFQHQPEALLRLINA